MDAVESAVASRRIPRELSELVWALKEKMLKKISVRCRERNESACWQKNGHKAYLKPKGSLLQLRHSTIYPNYRESKWTADAKRIYRTSN